MSSLETLTPSTIEEVFHLLSPAHKMWGTGSELDWVFRGLGSATFTLLPSAWRPSSTGEYPLAAIADRDRELVDQWLGSHGFDLPMAEDERTRFDCIYAELVAVWEFCELADQLGLPSVIETPAEKKIALDTALEMFDSPHAFPARPDVAAAQHSGIPTRLLDWSDHPLVALFFAAATNKVQNLGGDIRVWAFNRSAVQKKYHDVWDTIRIESPFRQSNHFMRAQRGLFTLTKGNIFFQENGRWPALDEIIARDEELAKCGPLLKRIEIPHSLIDPILRRLWRAGISIAHLMPSLPKVADAMKEKWSLQRSGAPWGT